MDNDTSAYCLHALMNSSVTLPPSAQDTTIEISEVFGDDWWTNTVFWLLVLGVFLIFYHPFSHSSWFQTRVHRFEGKTHLRHFGWFLQWYAITGYVLVALMFNEMWSVTWVTWASGEHNVATELLKQSDDWSWAFVMYLSWTGPWAGFWGFVICGYHLISVVRRGNSRRRRQSHIHPYRISPVQEMVVLIIALPLLLILMASKSTIRMWFKMSCDDLGFKATYDEVWYMINLQVASIWGYIVIFIFSNLMNMLMKHRILDPDVRWAMSWTSYQGTWAFVLVGVMQGVAEVTDGVLRLAANSEDYARLATGVGLVQTKMKSFAAVFMILCIFNMIVLCKIKLVKEALGNASLKFLATRMILIIIQYQPLLLSFLANPDEFLQIGPANKLLQGTDLGDFIKRLGITEDLAKLLNSSFLCWEGLLVVLFNFWAWERDSKEEDLYENEEGDSVMDLTHDRWKEIKKASGQKGLESLQTPLIKQLSPST